MFRLHIVNKKRKGKKKHGDNLILALWPWVDSSSFQYCFIKAISSLISQLFHVNYTKERMIIYEVQKCLKVFEYFLLSKKMN